MRTQFIKDLLNKEIQALADSKCPAELACGDDDRWYDDKQEQTDRLQIMKDVVDGKVSHMDAEEIRFFNTKIMKLQEEEFFKIRFNLDNYLSTLYATAEEAEAFDESIRQQGDPQ